MDSKSLELAIEKATEYIVAHPLPTDVVSVPLDQKLVAEHIDHTLLKPDATPAQIAVLCEEAKKHGFKVTLIRGSPVRLFILIQSCCVNSSHIPLVTSLLSGSSSIPCAVVGFPLGACTTSTKAFETTEVIKAGAKEIDMVINIGLLKSGDLVGVYDDVSSVVTVAADIPVKVIVETSLLTKGEKISASVIAALAGATYVKTSTGFNGGGATVEDVELMYQAVAFKKGTVKVKASGGVRSLEYGQFQVFLFFGLTTPQGRHLHVASWSRQARDIIRRFDHHWHRYSSWCILKRSVSPLFCIVQRRIVAWGSVCLPRTCRIKTATANPRSPLMREGFAEPRLGKVHEIVLFLALHCVKRSTVYQTVVVARFLTFGDAAQEVLMSQFCGTFPQSNHTCLNTNSLQLRTIKLVCTPRQLLKVYVAVHRHLPGVDLKNSRTRGLVRKREFDLPIQTAGSEKCRVKNIDPICCSDDLR